MDVVKVDVDTNASVSGAFGIMSIRPIAYFAPGKQPQSVAGFRKLEDLARIFDLRAAQRGLRGCRGYTKASRPGDAGRAIPANMSLRIGAPRQTVIMPQMRWPMHPGMDARNVRATFAHVDAPPDKESAASRPRTDTVNQPISRSRQARNHRNGVPGRVRPCAGP